MSYRVVKGEFRLFYHGRVRVGSQPDGDSVWFKPNKPKHLEDLDGRNAEFNQGGFAQLRFEAIDALELHFKGPRQELDASVAARGFTLRQLGFRNVEYSGGEGLAVRTAGPHPRPGYILTKAIDPYGRPVSFVFAGGTKRADGSDLFMNPSMLNRTVNAALAQCCPCQVRQCLSVILHRAPGGPKEPRAHTCRLCSKSTSTAWHVAQGQDNEKHPR